MGCFGIIIESPNKMKLQSACFNNKGEEIKNVSKQFNLEGLFDLFLFFYFLESVSHLPSLLVLLSNVTAFTRSRTSFQVLNPSQWARQTAPLPDKEIQLFNQESFNHQLIIITRKREKESSDEELFTSMSKYYQMTGGGIIWSDHWHTVWSKQGTTQKNYNY